MIFDYTPKGVCSKKMRITLDDKNVIEKEHENNHLDGITIMDLAEHFYEDDYPEENED